MNIDIPGLNVNNGLELYDGSEKIYLRFLRIYVSSMSAALENLRKVSKEALPEYVVSVHGVKGISETIGADEVSNMARQLEAMAREGDLDGVLARNDAFIGFAENFVGDIRNWLEKNTSN